MTVHCLRMFRVGLIGLAALLGGSEAARSQATAPAERRNVLVELYTSQGCNSCPPACDLLGKLTAPGTGSEGLVAMNFHVDYFNKPWVDPFADPSFSDRELSYNQVLRREDLYFTPMMMVDGRRPLLGSKRDQALAAIRQARGEPVGVSLKAQLDGSGDRRNLAVRLDPRGSAAANREVLVGVALTQDRVETAVPSGENAGRTLVEHHVVRHFDHKMVKLGQSEQSLSFPVELPANAKAAKFHVALFVQDRYQGQIYQAESLAWTAGGPLPTIGSRAQATTVRGGDRGRKSGSTPEKPDDAAPPSR